MRKVVKTFYALFFFLAGCLFSHAEEIKVTATTNRNPVGVNEQFIVSYNVNTNVSGFQAPSFKDFNILSGPNQSTSMQFINGAMSQSITFTYYLQARAEGTFRIDPASVSVNNTSIKSNSLNITVVKGQGKTQSNSGQGSNADDGSGGVSSNSVFLKVSVDKANLYQGEALIATYKLYTRVNVINYSVEKLPAFNGFWSQELKMPEQLELRNETYNGQQYRVGIIKKVILFPQQSGTLTLEPMQGTCIARVQAQNKRSNNPFDIFNDPFFSDPFFGGARDVKVAVKSEPVKINVKELPPTNDPFFKGTVGNFTMQASLDKNQVKANDAVNLKIKISGRGNLKLIDAPLVNLPTDVESYEPKVNDNLNVSETGVTGSKTFEYLLIPRHEGNYTIDPIHFTFFDLDKKQYVQLTSTVFNLLVKGVTGDASAAQSVASYQNKTDVKLLGKDIRFIKTSPLTLVTSDSFYGSSLFYVLLFLPLLLFIVIIFYKKRRDELNKNTSYVRSNKATKMAQKRLAAAKQYLDQNKIDVFYEELFKALYDFSSNKLGIEISDLTKENLATRLRERNVQEQTLNKLLSTIDTCEFARFASQMQTANPQQVYGDSVQIITELENQLS